MFLAQNLLCPLLDVDTATNDTSSYTTTDETSYDYTADQASTYNYTVDHSAYLDQTELLASYLALMIGGLNIRVISRVRVLLVALGRNMYVRRLRRRTVDLIAYLTEDFRDASGLNRALINTDDNRHTGFLINDFRHYGGYAR